MHSGAVGQNDTDRCFVILDVDLSSRIGGWAQHQVSHLRSRLVYAVELVNVQRDGQDVTWELQPWGVTVRCPHPHAELFKWDRGLYVDLQKIVPNRVLHDMFNDEFFRTRLHQQQFICSGPDNPYVQRPLPEKLHRIFKPLYHRLVDAELNGMRQCEGTVKSLRDEALSSYMMLVDNLVPGTSSQ